MTEDSKALPAKILLQVREGALNLISEFDLDIVSTEPIDPPSEAGGTKSHKVPISSIIYGLYGGLISESSKMVRQQSEPEKKESVFVWLDQMHEWFKQEVREELERASD